MQKTIVKKEWNVTTNRYVAFLDIMGFKDLVSRSSHEDIYHMMQSIENAKNINENIKWGKGEDKFIKSTFYSDSIILYSKDDSQDSAHFMNCTLSALTSDLLSSGIPHKGALAFGRMTLDTEKSIYFGQPLIDAYLLQEELNLYSIVLHSSAEYELEQRKFIDNLIIYNYLCPFKGGNALHFTIPPLYSGPAEEDEKEERDRLYNGIKKFRHRTSGHIRRYIDNTEAFLENFNKSFEEE